MSVSDAQMTKLCRSWVVMKFELYSWKHFDLKLFCYENSNFEFKKFKIRFFQTTSDGEMTKMNFVILKRLWNFVVDNVLIWNHLAMRKLRLNLKIWNSNFINDLGWRNSLNENYRSRKVIKLCSWQLFELTSFRASNKQFILGLV